IRTDFNIAEETSKIPLPQASKDFIKEYMSSDKLSDDFDQDILLMFERELIYGFDYLHGKEKLLIPEINPVTIFFSNAVMSHRKLYNLKDKLLKSSPRVSEYTKDVNPNDFGNFFQLASNCIINLQATVESFANRVIPDDYPFEDTNG